MNFFKKLTLVLLLATLTFASPAADVSLPGIGDSLSELQLRSEGYADKYSLGQEIFGEPWSIATKQPIQPGTKTILGPLSKVMTLGAVLLVSVLIAWTLISNSVNLASYGQAISQGKGIWTSARPILSVMFLAPVVKGYAFIQIILLAVASWGMLIADVAWVASVNHLGAEQQFVVKGESPEDSQKGTVLSQQARKLPIKNLFNSLVCYEFLQDLERRGYFQELNDSPNIVEAEKATQGLGHGDVDSYVAGGKTTLMLFGTQKHQEICGGFQVQTIYPRASSDLVLAGEIGLYDAFHIANIAAVKDFLDNSGIKETAQKAIEFISEEGLPVQEFYEGFNKFKLLRAYAVYQQAIAQKSVNVVVASKDNTQILETAKKTGWTFAGGFFWARKQINDRVHALLTNSELKTRSTITGLEKDGECSFWKRLTYNEYCTWNELLNQAGGYPKDQVIELFNSTNKLADKLLADVEKKDPVQAIKDDLKDYQLNSNNISTTNQIINKALDAIGVDINTNPVTKAMINTHDPLSTMQEAGHWLLTIAEIGYLGSIFIDFIIPEKLETFLSIGFFFIFVTGVFLAYYLPFLPLMQWISSIAGYALFLFEAFFGSIFWAAAHAMPEEGAGVAGQHAKQGYMLLLALLVRPVLMIAGLWGGIILSKVLVNFAGNISIPFMATVHNTNVVGLVGWIAVNVIMALVALSIVRRSFNLTFELPDRVVRWIGHSGENLGEHQDERDIKDKFFAAYSKASGGVSMPGGGAGKEGIKNTMGSAAKDKGQDKRGKG